MKIHIDKDVSVSPDANYCRWRDGELSVFCNFNMEDYCSLFNKDIDNQHKCKECIDACKFA